MKIPEKLKKLAIRLARFELKAIKWETIFILGVSAALYLETFLIWRYVPGFQMDLMHLHFTASTFITLSKLDAVGNIIYAISAVADYDLLRQIVKHAEGR